MWIAFNFVSLQCETQQLTDTEHQRPCCELLSILYLCSVKHNVAASITKWQSVVNCFQFCIFAVWNTTGLQPVKYREVLWIAFNFVSLQCETQQFEQFTEGDKCCELLSILYLCSVKHNVYCSNINITFCELLSILYLCSVKHNFTSSSTALAGVVNCFQFCIFAVWNTTQRVLRTLVLWLWIAFNFVSLQCETQH